MNREQILTELLLSVLQSVEKLGPLNEDVVAIKDRLQTFFDNQSKPLRDAVFTWGVQHDVGFMSEWRGEDRRWRLDRSDIKIEIDEIGSCAWVNGERVGRRVTTPRMLKIRLTKLLLQKKHSLKRSTDV